MKPAFRIATEPDAQIRLAMMRPGHHAGFHAGRSRRCVRRLGEGSPQAGNLTWVNTRRWPPGREVPRACLRVVTWGIPGWAAACTSSSIGRERRPPSNFATSRKAQADALFLPLPDYERIDVAQAGADFRNKSKARIRNRANPATQNWAKVTFFVPLPPRNSANYTSG